MMNPDVKDRWIGALMSGDYRQTTGRLIEVEGGQRKYCCLGVLSELHAEATGAVKAVGCSCGTSCSQWEFKDAEDGGTRQEGMPLPVTYEWAGLEEEDATFLADINDGGAPFNVVAAYIRRHL